MWIVTFFSRVHLLRFPVWCGSGELGRKSFGARCLPVKKFRPQNAQAPVTQQAEPDLKFLREVLQTEVTSEGKEVEPSSEVAGLSCITCGDDFTDEDRVDKCFTCGAMFHCHDGLSPLCFVEIEDVCYCGDYCVQIPETQKEE